MAVKVAISPLGGLLAALGQGAIPGTTRDANKSEISSRAGEATGLRGAVRAAGPAVPPFCGLEDLPQPGNEVGRAVLQFPAPARPQLYHWKAAGQPDRASDGRSDGGESAARACMDAIGAIIFS